MPSAVPRLPVAAKPPKPLVLFDGDCRFCQLWAKRWQNRWGARLDVRPWQSEHSRFPEIPLSAFEEALQLVEPNGRVRAGADAVLHARALGRDRRSLALRCYEGPAFTRAAIDLGYKLVARNRRVLSWFL